MSKLLERFQTASSRFGFWTIVFVAAFIPTVFFPHWVLMKGEWYEFWLDRTSEMDSYSWGKSKLIILSGFFLLTCVLVRRQSTDTNTFATRKFTLMMCLLGMGFCYTLSTIFAEHSQMAFVGFPGRYEGFSVVICYLVIAYAASVFVRTSAALKIFFNFLMLSAVWLSFAGMSQYSGHDFWASPVGTTIATVGKSKEFQNSLRFPNNLFWNATTLYNTNYVGSYMAMLLPLTIAFFLKEQRLKFKILLGSVSAICFLQLYASYSRAGMLATLAGLGLMAILGFKVIKRQWREVLLLCNAYIAVSLGVNAFDGGRNSERLNVAGAEMKGGSKKDRYISFERVGLGAKIVTSTETLIIQTDLKDFWFEEESGTRIPFTETNFVRSLQHPKYTAYSFAWWPVSKSIRMHRGDDLLFWSIQPDGLYVKGFREKILAIKPIPQIGFRGYDTAMSARAFIWSRSLPLLKDTLLIGKGPDTYPAYFPQDDFRGQLNVHGKLTWVVDKPHNFYIQIAHAAGMPALFLFVLMVCCVVWWLLTKNRKIVFLQENDLLNLGLGTAIGSYCLSVIFNDSLVSVAPVFWALVGVAMGRVLSSTEPSSESILSV